MFCFFNQRNTESKCANICLVLSDLVLLTLRYKLMVHHISVKSVLSVEYIRASSWFRRISLFLTFQLIIAFMSSEQFLKRRNANHSWIQMSDWKTVTFMSYCLCPSQIAEHVDSTDGFLSKLSLYKALALIALAQQGKQPSPKLLENCIQGRWQQSNKVFA